MSNPDLFEVRVWTKTPHTYLIVAAGITPDHEWRFSRAVVEQTTESILIHENVGKQGYALTIFSRENVVAYQERASR